MQLGRAPLHCAAAGGHSSVVDTLLTAGAALDLTDKVSHYSTLFVNMMIITESRDRWPVTFGRSSKVPCNSFIYSSLLCAQGTVKIQ